MEGCEYLNDSKSFKPLNENGKKMGKIREVCRWINREAFCTVVCAHSCGLHSSLRIFCPLSHFRSNGGQGECDTLLECFCAETARAMCNLCTKLDGNLIFYVIFFTK